MEKIGVEAIVEGLNQFLGDLGKMDSGLSKLEPKGTLLQRTFAFLGDTVSSLGREILNVAEYALGQLLSNAIEFVVQKIRELVMATIEAGNEFQVLSIRLDRLNFNELIASGKSFNEAMSESTKMTKEQLSWLQKLAAQTPYDNQDIANVYTLARSYGYAADQAQGLTEDIINFASGMGLGSQEMERIIVNFGQMTQQGKVTGRELTDLARGAFVPVNKVLQQMQKDTGLTGAAFDKFKNSAEGVDAFMRAFSHVVETEFSGAAEKLARTFEGASRNAMDMVKSIVGLNVVKPVLDMIGGKVADFLGEFTKGRTVLRDFGGHMVEVADSTLWDQMVVAATRIGTAISEIVSGIFDLLPSTEGVADNIVASVESMADWIEDNKDEIIQFFKDLGTSIQNNIVPFIYKVVDGFSTISDWVSDNQELIKEFFGSLGEIVSGVIENLTGQEIGGKRKGLEGFLEILKKLMKFVITNEDKIISVVTAIVIGFLLFQVVATVIATVISALLSFLGTVIGIGVFIVGLISLLNFLAPAFSIIATIITGLVIPAIVAVIGFIGAMIVPILLVIATIALLVIAFNTNWAQIWETVRQSWEIIKFYLARMNTSFAEWAEATAGKIVTWATSTWGAIVKWGQNVIASIALWAEDTLAKISVWAMNSSREISTWVSDTKSKIMGWVSNIGGVITKWANDSLRSIRQFGIESVTAFSQWGANAYNALLASVNSINWFAIGVQIISEIIAGFSSMSLPPVNPPPTNDGGGGIIGHDAGSGPGAHSSSGPSQMSQSVPASSIVNSSVVINNEMNLTIHTSAKTEPIIQDFATMKSMLGG